MYERFYGLSRTPFAVTPDPAMLFMSRVHREALATIIYGVETRKGFIVCTGEVGTGKSTIIRAFFDETPAESVKLIYIFTPQVTPFEMARYICRELGIGDPESVFAAVPQLQLTLLEVFESGRTVVLMIDEAQLLPPETLEFLRLLSNFETDTEKLMQIVLVGQPEVDTMLARRDMRQVNQRVALRARLAALDVQESVDYLDHRLRVSGAAELAQVMSPSAAWLIAEAAGGIPRRINILADNALIAGFGAAQRPLGSQLAGRAVRDFTAKSGAADPPASAVTAAAQRFVPGWRSMRRLRGALAREQREEPAEWPAPTAPPPPSPPQRQPVAAAPQSPAADPSVAGWRVSRMEPGSPPPPAAAGMSGGDAAAAAAVVAVAPPVEAGGPAEIAAAEILAALIVTAAPEEAAVPAAPSQNADGGDGGTDTAKADTAGALKPDNFIARVAKPVARRDTRVWYRDVAIIEPVIQPPEPFSTDGPALVEPVAPPRSDYLWGLPVSLDGIIVVEPVAQPQPPLLDEDRIPSELPRRSPPPAPFPAEDPAMLAHASNAASARSDRAMTWPALSRVRSGLRPAGRDSPDRHWFRPG